MRAKVFFQVFILVLVFLSFIGCGGGGNNSNTVSSTVIYGKAILGNLAGATVEVYEVADDGSLILKWVEITRGDDTTPLEEFRGNR